jgi:hypothetical protein
LTAVAPTPRAAHIAEFGLQTEMPRQVSLNPGPIHGSLHDHVLPAAGPGAYGAANILRKAAMSTIKPTDGRNGGPPIPDEGELGRPEHDRLGRFFPALLALTLVAAASEIVGASRSAHGLSGWPPS